MKLNNIFQLAFEWVFRTPERAVDQAYRAALKIKDIEDKHFNGNRVSKEFSSYGDTVVGSLKSEVQGYLQIINIRRAEFQVSRLFTILSNLGNFQPELREDANNSLSFGQAALMLDKLSFIDSIVAKYKKREPFFREPIEPPEDNIADKEPLQRRKSRKISESEAIQLLDEDNDKYQKTNYRRDGTTHSIFGAFSRLRQEIDPKIEEGEEAVLRKHRARRYKTFVSIRFVLILIIVPLIANQISKTLLVTPILNNYFKSHEQFVFINRDFEEEAFRDLRNFEEGLRFKELIGLPGRSENLTIEEQVKERASEISGEFRNRGIGAISNIFSDLFALIAFGLVIVFSRREIMIVKSFLDGILFDLSDSAKAFLIILFTDVFVGFHSPHGWEVVLEGMARHFGFPENREFNFLFIATFPVILDTVMKYWIFRYLNRISPSAVATYRNMNE
jgi:hypothetical protein